MSADIYEFRHRSELYVNRSDGRVDASTPPTSKHGREDCHPLWCSTTGDYDDYHGHRQTAGSRQTECDPVSLVLLAMVPTQKRVSRKRRLFN